MNDDAWVWLAVAIGSSVVCALVLHALGVPLLWCLILC